MGRSTEGGGLGRRGRHRPRRSFVFILLLAGISTADAAAESDGYGELSVCPLSGIEDGNGVEGDMCLIGCFCFEMAAYIVFQVLLGQTRANLYP